MSSKKSNRPCQFISMSSSGNAFQIREVRSDIHPSKRALEVDLEKFRTGLKTSVALLVSKANGKLSDPQAKREFNKQVKLFWDKQHELERALFDPKEDPLSIAERLDKIKAEFENMLSQYD